jgi:hypothetical protein
MSARARTLATAVVVLAACGPIDQAAGQISDQAAGPSAFLTDVAPRAAARFTVSVNDAARMNDGEPGFSIQSDQLDLASRESALPVDVALKAVDGSHRFDLLRGRCRGERCVGTFDIIFRRHPGASGAIRFDWSVVAFVDLSTHEVPDGAAVDVSFP